MKRLAIAAGCAVLLAATQVDDVSAQAKKAPSPKSQCATKHGKGFAPTEGMARFQAWEIIAQTTGNWPIQTDTFKNERYRCSPDGWGVTCYAKIDVCSKS